MARFHSVLGLVAAVVAGGLVSQGMAATTYTLDSSTLFADFTTPTPNTTAFGYSIRGLAVSDDGSNLYAGFIHGNNGATADQVAEYSTGSAAGLNPTPVATVAQGPNQQPKGVATDDRGFVYATRNYDVSTSSQKQKFSIYQYSGSSVSTVTTTNVTVPNTNDQLAGATVWHDTASGHYYLYLSFNKGTSNGIQRWDVTNTASPTLDTTFGVGGMLNINTLTGQARAGINGIDVASDGTIYAAGLFDNSALKGQVVYKINVSGTSILMQTMINGAMDLAIADNNDIYVSQYLSNQSAISVLKMSDLSVDANVTITIDPSILAAHTNLDLDSGFSGIDVDADGTIYVADQAYAGSGSSAHDRIFAIGAVNFASATVPTPAALASGLTLLGALGCVKRFRK